MHTRKVAARLSIRESVEHELETTSGKLYTLGSVLGIGCIFVALYHPIRLVEEERKPAIETIAVSTLLALSLGLKIPYLYHKILGRLVLIIWCVGWTIITILNCYAYSR